MTPSIAAGGLRVRDRRWRRAARNWVVADDAELRRSDTGGSAPPGRRCAGLRRNHRPEARPGCGCRRGGPHRRRIRQPVTIDRAELTAIRGREEIASLDELGVGPHRVGFSVSAMAACETKKRPPPAAWSHPRGGPPRRGARHRSRRRSSRPRGGLSDREASPASTGSEAAVVEYPVWWWQHWPWGPLPVRGRGGVRNSLDG